MVLAGQPADPAALCAAVEQIGYRLTPIDLTTQLDAGEEEAAAERAWLHRVIVGWPLALAVGYLAMFSGALRMQPWVHWVEFVLTTPVQFYVGWPFLRGDARRARHRAANMDTLIAMGS